MSANMAKYEFSVSFDVNMSKSVGWQHHIIFKV